MKVETVIYHAKNPSQDLIQISNANHNQVTIRRKDVAPLRRMLKLQMSRPKMFTNTIK